MAEENKETKETQEEVKEDPKPINFPNPSPTLEEAKKINQEKKELLDREEAIMARKETLHAEQMVSGNSQAGQAPAPAETSDDKWARESKERYEGTGYDPTPDNTPTTFS